jgi:hypothetical protein
VQIATLQSCEQLMLSSRCIEHGLWHRDHSFITQNPANRF